MQWPPAIPTHFIFQRVFLHRAIIVSFHKKQQHYNSLWPHGWLLKEPLGVCCGEVTFNLRSRTECVPAVSALHDVHGGDGLSLGGLGVSNGITDHVLQEHLQHTTSLLVDQTGYTFDSAAASETTDGGFSDALDVIPQNFTVTLSASFPSPLPPLPLPDMTIIRAMNDEHADGKTYTGRPFTFANRT